MSSSLMRPILGGDPPESTEACVGAPSEPADPSVEGINVVVGANLRRLRVRRGLSLERLSRKSGVSRAMLSQVELGQSTPTINLLWKIACALDVTFSALISARPNAGTLVMRCTQAKHLTSLGGHFTSRALFPFDEPRRTEFYELRLDPYWEESAEPHPPGTIENLVVTTGAMEIVLDHDVHSLSAGDAILFQADQPHAYRNRGPSAALMYLVMTYAETVG